MKFCIPLEISIIVRSTACAALVALAAACASTANLGVDDPPAVAGTATDSSSRASIEQGRLMAERVCSRCHAVGPSGDSPHKDAIPFREIGMRYPVEDLAEAFAEGITVGHPDMPPFELDPDQIDALIDYLETVQTHARG